MKLSLLSFDIGRHLDLPTLLRVAHAKGFAAIELRMQLGHAHGVDLDLDAAARRSVRNQFDDALVDIAGLGVSNRFEFADAAARQASVDECKRYLELAADLDAQRLRVFGNDMPRDAGTNRADVIAYVGDCLRELGEFAEGLDLEVNLEMHGQFNWWRYALRAVEHADHPAVGIVYNCDPRDVCGGSIRETLSQVYEYVNHIHMHELDASDYPYRELLPLLEEWGYEGYLSAEIAQSSDPERVLGLYAALYRAYLGR